MVYATETYEPSPKGTVEVLAAWTDIIEPSDVAINAPTNMIVRNVKDLPLNLKNLIRNSLH
jgi:hypothetical protein